MSPVKGLISGIAKSVVTNLNRNILLTFLGLSMSTITSTQH